MTGLPTPPEAYWSNIPWWAYLGFMLVAMMIVVVIGPWMIQRARGRPSAIVSREEAVASQEKAIRTRADEELARVIAERDHFKADYATGWDAGRGMEVHAHRLWHDGVNAVQRANALLILLQRIIAGKLRSEVALELIAEYQPLVSPGPIPRLTEVEPKGPHETKYT